MKVRVFAMLKDHFEKEFDVDTPFADPGQLKNYLIKLKPQASSILNNCRFAVNDDFVDINYKLQLNDTIVILPPSSGG